MKNLPNIDIIIPNYNKADYLKECLNSVLNQTYKNWRVYLIDDCSNDTSQEILKNTIQKTRLTSSFWIKIMAHLIVKFRNRIFKNQIIFHF